MEQPPSLVFSDSRDLVSYFSTALTQHSASRITRPRVEAHGEQHVHPGMMTFQAQLEQRQEAETDYTAAEAGNRNRLHRSRDRKGPGNDTGWEGLIFRDGTWWNSGRWHVSSEAPEIALAWYTAERVVFTNTQVTVRVAWAIYAKLSAILRPRERSLHSRMKKKTAE